MGRLTDKQAAFVDEYLVDLNATAAAKRAGYSEKTARQIGSQNLTKPKIQERIQKRRQELQEETQVTQQDVIEGLHNEAEGAESDSARVSAWKALGKHFGMFTDVVQHEGGIDIEVVYEDDPAGASTAAASKPAGDS